MQRKSLRIISTHGINLLLLVPPSVRSFFEHLRFLCPLGRVGAHECAASQELHRNEQLEEDMYPGGITVAQAPSARIHGWLRVRCYVPRALRMLRTFFVTAGSKCILRQISFWPTLTGQPIPFGLTFDRTKRASAQSRVLRDCLCPWMCCLISSNAPPLGT